MSENKPQLTGWKRAREQKKEKEMIKEPESDEEEPEEEKSVPERYDEEIQAVIEDQQKREFEGITRTLNEIEEL